MSSEPKTNPQNTPLLTLALTKHPRDYEWDQETFLDIVYYLHHILSIIFGLTWGILGLTGAGAMIGYLVLSAMVVCYYVGTFQDQDFEDFGGISAVLKDGFMNRFATFLICWTLDWFILICMGVSCNSKFDVWFWKIEEK